jgi:hypothetical protein
MIAELDLHFDKPFCNFKGKKNLFSIDLNETSMFFWDKRMFSISVSRNTIQILWNQITKWKEFWYKMCDVLVHK